MEPLISVIIPIYNMEAYLARCLDSVLNNTYRNLEIICVDDGSTDSSAEILRAYAEKDSRIVPIFKENGGVSSARNAGLDRMTGDFVTFIDSDDFVHPQFFEQFVIAQRETGADLVIGGFQGVSEQNLPIDMKPVKQDDFQRWKADCVTVFKNHFLGAYSTARLIGTHLIKGIRFPLGMDYSEDTLFFSALWEQKMDINCWVLNNRLYYYFTRPTSTTNVISCERRVAAIRESYRMAAEKPQFRQIWLAQGVGRELQFLKYYRNSLHDARAVRLIAREMRSHLWRILFSNLFTIKEKLFYAVKALFPFLRRGKTL